MASHLMQSRRGLKLRKHLKVLEYNSYWQTTNKCRQVSTTSYFERCDSDIFCVFSALSPLFCLLLLKRWSEISFFFILAISNFRLVESHYLKIVSSPISHYIKLLVRFFESSRKRDSTVCTKLKLVSYILVSLLYKLHNVELLDGPHYVRNEACCLCFI